MSLIRSACGSDADRVAPWAAPSAAYSCASVRALASRSREQVALHRALHGGLLGDEAFGLGVERAPGALQLLLAREQHADLVLPGDVGVEVGQLALELMVLLFKASAAVFTL